MYLHMSIMGRFIYLVALNSTKRSFNRHQVTDDDVIKSPCMDGCMYVWMYGWLYGLMHGWTHGWINGWMYGYMWPLGGGLLGAPLEAIKIILKLI